MATTPNLVRPLLQVNTVDGGTVQQGGQIVGLDDGGYVIVYNDQSPAFTTAIQSIVGQRFNAAGNKVGGELRVSAFDDGDDSVADGSSITNLHNGKIAFAYTDVFNGHSDVWVRVLNPALGVVRDDAIDTSAAQTRNASITSFADGGYAVSYTLDNGSGNTDIVARIVSATGVVGAPITVRDNGTADADFSQLATLSNGNFVDVFQQHSGLSHGIYLAIYTSSGAQVTYHDVLGANDFFEETDPDVAALVGGGFVVAWTDAQGDDNKGGEGPRMSIYDNAGHLVAGDIQIHTTTQLAQNEVSLVALQDGGFVATWEDDAYALVRGQRFDATGHQIGGEFVVKNYSSAQPNDTQDGALLADGRFAFALGDFSAGDRDVFTSIFSPRSHTNDFNGDGKADILWQNDNGTPAITLMDGVSPISGAYLPNAGPAWHVKAGADFNGDGKADILWQNDDGTPAVTLMDGLSPVSGAYLPNAGPAWHVKAGADFNGDGKADILWQNDDGTPAITLMNGLSPISGAYLPNAGVAWHVKAAADFNGDGKADILLQNDDGTPRITLMNGLSPISGANLPNPDPIWQVKDASDFNGDGKADIIWQHDNGTPAITLMDGLSPVGGGSLINAGSDWHVI